ncbi:MAG TPA: hypothetical protein PL098_00210 [Brevundimonas diminuta]|nr:hypothetical protein [Brevundimonas diminuta]HRL23327.1 hypothetical protein [Brevundimonas diminuta]
MAAEKYEVLEPSYINDAVREPGDIVELDIKYDAKRDTNLKPVSSKKVKPTVDAPSAAKASGERTTDEGEPTTEGGNSTLA